MKWGIALLIAGVIFASTGLALRQIGIKQQSTTYMEMYNTGLQQGLTQESIGIGFLGLGGGLFVSGIIIMIFKTRSKS
jgi:tartrate dehydratase alpha subunit/fumarate hydratase class I-like protein